MARCGGLGSETREEALHPTRSLVWPQWPRGPSPNGAVAFKSAQREVEASGGEPGTVPAPVRLATTCHRESPITAVSCRRDGGGGVGLWQTVFIISPGGEPSFGVTLLVRGGHTPFGPDERLALKRQLSAPVQRGRRTLS